MAATAQSKGRVLEGFYRVIMRRTPVYATFVIVGAFLGERVSLLPSHFRLWEFSVTLLVAVDYGVHKLWESRGLGIWEGLTVHLKKVEVLDSEKAHFLDACAV
ncbi:hypothetical protein RJ639_032817 [Escallonia herrerae]|uniref:Uncharacterized protein n=1 Tax=Escallonia herrerae TaxID=1293975 RepID=A0AA89B9J6_9ASTE|nr:hypothetical protein RJ639_032817 [Escallonia herrerae]